MPAGVTKCSAVIVAASQTSYAAIKQIVAGVFSSVAFAGSMAEVKQKASAGLCDIVIINTPIPDEFGVNSALDIVTRFPFVQVMVLVKADLYEQVTYKVKGYGIFVLSRPIRGQTLLEGVRMLESMHGKIAQLQNENLKLKRRLDETTIVTRAKCLLIEKKSMSEEEAHYYLERTAMDSSKSKKEVAQEIIRELDPDQ